MERQTFCSIFGRFRTKGHTQDSQNRSRSHKPIDTMPAHQHNIYWRLCHSLQTIYFVKLCNSYNNFRKDNNRSNRYICMFNKQRCMLSILFDQILNCVCIFIIVWQDILIHRRSCKCFVCNKLGRTFFSFKENNLIIYIIYSNYG
jgi:hypothetical protein